jgi:hypothetical protein
VAPTLRFPVPAKDVHERDLDSAVFRSKFPTSQIATDAANLLVTQSSAIVQGEISAHGGQDSRTLAFLGADVAAMALLPTLSTVTSTQHWWWVLVAFGLAVLCLAISVMRWTVGSGGYQLGPDWTEYVKALPRSVDALEVNLVMVRELDRAILKNARLFNSKNSVFNAAIGFNVLAGLVALLVFWLHV